MEPMRVQHDVQRRSMQTHETDSVWWYCARRGQLFGDHQLIHRNTEVWSFAILAMEVLYGDTPWSEYWDIIERHEDVVSADCSSHTVARIRGKGTVARTINEA